MQIKNKIFPYPILNFNKGLSNFGDLNFDFEFIESEDVDSFILKDAKFNTDSKLINRLFDENKISVYCVVECSYTVYRKAFKISKEKNDILLPKNDFTEKVEISMYAVANENFELKSDEFDEEYQDIDFEIEKYDIVAANDGFNVHFIHEEKEDNLVKSIFSIIPSENIDDGTFSVECNQGRKIVIAMSKKDHANYKVIYTDLDYKEVFFNMLIIPALVEGLNICKNFINNDSSADMDDVGNAYLWFRSVLSSYKRLVGKELTVDEFKEISMISLAQIVMGKPLGIALDKLVHKPAKGGMNSYED